MQIGIGVGIGFGGKPDVTYTISRDTAGLLYEDQFGSLDGDWLNGNGSGSAVISVSGGVLTCDGNCCAYRVVSTPSDGDQIVQANLKGNFPGVFGYGDNDNEEKDLLAAQQGGISGYGCRHRDNLNRFEGMQSWLTGNTIVKAGGVDPTNNTFQTNRVVIEHVSATNKKVRFYYATSLADSEDRSNDVTQFGTELDDTEFNNGKAFGDAPKHVGIWFNDSGQQADQFFVCGRNIVVTGLANGHKIQVDARAAVEESGGTVTIDVDTWALPATTIKLLDAGDNELATLTPDGGIWGGDEYSV